MSVAQDTIDHAAYIRKLREVGGQAIQEQHSTAPAVDAGLFDYQEWAPNVWYEQGDLFMYEGQPGFVRQSHTSSAVYPPYSIGVEALYGARPRQEPDGTYPYVYNMRAEIGMRVRSNNGKVYVCISPSDPLLYDPENVPALFEEEPI